MTVHSFEEVFAELTEEQKAEALVDRLLFGTAYVKQEGDDYTLLDPLDVIVRIKNHDKGPNDDTRRTLELVESTDS